MKFLFLTRSSSKSYKYTTIFDCHSISDSIVKFLTYKKWHGVGWERGGGSRRSWEMINHGYNIMNEKIVFNIFFKNKHLYVISRDTLYGLKTR